MTGKYIKRQVLKKRKAICKYIKDIPYNIRHSYVKGRVVYRDFTVISNNCWAGKLYQYLDMQYLTPTVGLYFFSDDYLKFIKNLRYYISLDLEFIKPEDSNHKDIIYERNHEMVPIAKLDDVEIIFLHYKTAEEALQKWNRRKKRIRWDNIYFKFSQMNYCSNDMLEEFCDLSGINKILISKRRKSQYFYEYYWEGDVYEHDGLVDILSDTDPFPGTVNLEKIFR